MSTITKQWLQQKIADMEAARDEIPFGLDEDDSNTLAALRIALASLEAEPAGWQVKKYGGNWVSIKKEDVDHYRFNEELPVREVYTAPPAPVSVPDEDLLHMAASAIEDLLSNKDRYCAGVWADIPAKLRRAAMLQGAEPVNQNDELPLDYLQGHKDGLEWAAQLAKANHPQTGDWLYDDPTELARAIRKGPDMPTAQAGNHTEQHLDMVDHSGDANKMVAGNSPVIPNGYVLVPKEITCAMDDAAWEAYHETRCMSDIWAALLAAAPKQEVKP